MPYSEWLKYAFGSSLADTFPTAYTRKYWTCNPSNLTVDWVGSRVYFPTIASVREGFNSPPSNSTHYIKKVRYPARGDFFSFAKLFANKANVNLNHQVREINLNTRTIRFINGKTHSYERLINTIPLPEFVSLCINPPKEFKQAATNLRCTSLLLVNITAEHTNLKPYHWLYVYDEDMLSTRINHIQLLSPHNTPFGKTGVQVEVDGSPYRPLSTDHTQIANKVVKELVKMELIKSASTVSTQLIPYANIIYDHPRRDAQNLILD